MDLHTMSKQENSKDSLILSVVNRFEDCGKIIYHSFSKLASKAYLGSEFHE